MNLREQIWNARLDAKMNVRYFTHLSQRYERRDRWIKILIALTSSSSVGGWTLWEHLNPLWQILSGFTAVLAIASPIRDYPKLIGQLRTLYGSWLRTEYEWEKLWIRSQNGEQISISDYDQVRTKELSLSENESNIPDEPDLIKRCQREVRLAERLSNHN